MVLKGLTVPDYSRYAQLKAAWIYSHPDATPAQYTAAMVRLARECGV